MIIKYNIDISQRAVEKELERLINQIYKLLPSREEGLNWELPLATVLEEIAGMHRLLIDQDTIVFPLLCKLEGLFTLTGEDDFFIFRRTIFECLGIVNNLKDELC
jgi:hypothetical protein